MILKKKFTDIELVEFKEIDGEKKTDFSKILDKAKNLSKNERYQEKIKKIRAEGIWSFCKSSIRWRGRDV